MKKGTKIGWIMIALSIVLSVWVIVSQSTRAEKKNPDAEEAGFELDQTNTILLSYNNTPPGGILAGAGSSKADYEAGRFPSTVTTIGTAFLSNNGSVTEVDLPSNVTTLQEGAFNGSYVTKVSMTDATQMTAIPSNAFKEAYSLSNLTLPTNLQSIGGQAFYGTPLTSITIPAGVNDISLGTGASNAFDGASDLTAINVDSGNSYYTSNNGCLYSTTGRLLAVPQGYVPQGSSNDTLTLPGSATGISAYALEGAYNVKHVELPASVTSIDTDAFTNSDVEKLTVKNRNLALSSSMGLPYDAVIEGYLNSTAQTFADSNGYTFLPLDGSNTTDNNNSNNNGTNTNGNNGTNNNGNNGNNNNGNNGNNNNGTNGNNSNGTNGNTNGNNGTNGNGTNTNGNTNGTNGTGTNGSSTNGSSGTNNGNTNNGSNSGTINNGTINNNTNNNTTNNNINNSGTNSGNTNGTNTNGTDPNTNNAANANGNNGTTPNGTNGNTTPATPATPTNNGGTAAPHTTDNTPKTADGDLDPRFAIALAVFAGGLAMIILSRRQRAVIIHKAGNAKLDD